MSGSGDFRPGDEEHPFEEEIDRYMVYTHTDGGDDGWIDFYSTIDSASEAIKALIHDEWGFGAAYDLDADRYSDYLPLIEVNVKLGTAKP